MGKKHILSPNSRQQKNGRPQQGKRLRRKKKRRFQVWEKKRKCRNTLKDFIDPPEIRRGE